MRILAWFLPLLAAVFAAYGAAGTGEQAGFLFQFTLTACALFIAWGCWVQRDYGWAFAFVALAVLCQPFLHTPVWGAVRTFEDAEGQDVTRWVWAPAPIMYALALIFPAHYLWLRWRAARPRPPGTLRATDN